mmetsp:Transcript_8500/g.34968  ORF Transcript_8500/g.34968 Transcript_8500/m.34968 type:complete len:88 (-) Transcript_8500:55-318(-)
MRGRTRSAYRLTKGCDASESPFLLGWASEDSGRRPAGCPSRVRGRGSSVKCRDAAPSSSPTTLQQRTTPHVHTRHRRSHEPVLRRCC